MCGFFTFTYSMGDYKGISFGDWGDFLNSCCMGFPFTIIFWKGSHILFWNLFLRTLKDF